MYVTLRSRYNECQLSFCIPGLSLGAVRVLAVFETPVLTQLQVPHQAPTQVHAVAVSSTLQDSVDDPQVVDFQDAVPAAAQFFDSFDSSAANQESSSGCQLQLQLQEVATLGLTELAGMLLGQGHAALESTS